MKVSIIWMLFAVCCQAAAVFADPCPFCTEEIIEDQQVFESAYFHVLVDYRPRVEGHLLVVPKRHVAMAHELTEQEWQELSAVINKIVQVFKDFLDIGQYMILEKNGPKAFQEIPHVHFHLLPVRSQKWREIFDVAPRQLEREELLQEVAAYRNAFLN